MKTFKSSPAAQLGFPEPQDTKVGDVDLRALYENFVQQLVFVAGRRVILSDPYIFSVSTDGISKSVKKWYASITEADRKKLLLLSLVSRPFDASFLGHRWRPKIRNSNEFHLFWVDPYSASLTESASAIPYGLDSLPGRRQALAEPTLKLLVDQIPKLTQIETLSSEFLGYQPGNYEYQSWQIAKWSESWAAVYGVTDAGHAEGYPFPWLLGFCKPDHPERNFIKLLREGTKRFDEGFYSTYGKVESSWDKAIKALERDEDG